MLIDFPNSSFELKSSHTRIQIIMYLFSHGSLEEPFSSLSLKKNRLSRKIMLWKF